MYRRTVLEGLLTTLMLGATGCKTPSPLADIKNYHSIDAHCHIFNASDLPVVRFVRYAFLKLYPELSQKRRFAPKEPDILDGLLELLLNMLGANKAPRAKDEALVLRGMAKANPFNASEAGASRIAIPEIAKFISRNATSSFSARSDRSGTSSSSQLLADRIIEAGGGDLRATRTFRRVDFDKVAADAFSSDSVIGVYLKWFNLFSLYRYELLELLISRSREQGLTPTFIAPAIVDLDKWLRETSGSSLPDQMIVMSLLSRRNTNPPVHGYFPFDPLREVYFRRKMQGEVSSLKLCRDALTTHGFLGVKLYPPMGFRASGNSGPYPRKIENEIGRNGLSHDLDLALDDLYKLCVELDAPILTHAYASQAPNKDFGLRADPAFWSPVFQKYPTLRVCLGHFGAFNLLSATRPSDRFPEASWEWTFGRDLLKFPRQRLFADMSYFSEALTLETSERAALATTFRQWVDRFDPEMERLVFGTDWVLVAREQKFEQYVPQVRSFLQNDCGIDDARLKRFFEQNAIDFLGLKRRDRTRQRLLEFYSANDLDPPRLL